MKKAVLLVSFMALSLTTVTNFAAQASVTVTAHVYKALTVTQSQAMDFGDLYVTTGSSATKTATGAFQVTGEENASISIDYPDTVTLAGPASSSLTVDIQTNDENETLNGSGQLTKSFSGEVTVNATTAAGDYTGTATITVTYV
ncbi:hypothetical protein Psal006b_03051 [Piscirickettsia salmonis]|uniref:Uncharacterized protein n=1 Tax=Piscirickettsia salmonis TaxID=1238 RepID=A0A1L6TG43_PISSA|nr:DUF4402 domain-containing protein [Piscirickettsia salmonis]AKP74715.1 hypothetical protein PSLF89_3225 [Piscirickettsia salmonis LF-89 = ATCC VR-1361]ALB21361.1 hypothetical protein KU39_175 [Piscirickettsia salmonis]ALY01600.1 hypothetical protein AWE47_00870 [Piscirickettsia salmonis]AMA41112.1 hypothetical protein AWJ11_00865 [Piscirickettsia salmonis]AOS36302.1 hypothetical protein AVM72_13860 [Piscirickettsia salmonis]